jgi:hypothetical protein
MAKSLRSREIMFPFYYERLCNLATLSLKQFPHLISLDSNASASVNVIETRVFFSGADCFPYEFFFNNGVQLVSYLTDPHKASGYIFESYRTYSNPNGRLRYYKIYYYSLSNRNEYQKMYLRLKRGRSIRLIV